MTARTSTKPTAAAVKSDAAKRTTDAKRQGAALRAFTKAEAAARGVTLEAEKIAAKRVDSYVIRAVATVNLFDAYGGRDKRGVQSNLATETGIKRPTLIKWYDDGIAVREAGVTNFDLAEWGKSAWTTARDVVSERYALKAEAAKGWRQAQAEKPKPKAAPKAEPKVDEAEDSVTDTPEDVTEDALTYAEPIGLVEQALAQFNLLVQGETEPTEDERERLANLLAEFTALV